MTWRIDLWDSNSHRYSMLEKDWRTRRYCIARFADFMWSMMIKFTKVDEFFINYSGKYLYWIFVNYIARIKLLSKEVFILFQFMSLFSVHFSWLMEFVSLGVQVSKTENLRQWRRRECENGCVCAFVWFIECVKVCLQRYGKWRGFFNWHSNLWTAVNVVSRQAWSWPICSSYLRGSIQRRNSLLWETLRCIRWMSRSFPY